MSDAKSKTAWRVLETEPGAAGKLARSLDIPQWLAAVLCLRGHADPDSAREFLDPSLAGLPRPDGLKGLDQAIEVLLPAVMEGKTIGVAGDYDADGVTSTSLLTDFLTQAGAKVVWQIPHRIKDGYGFSPAVAQRLAKAGAQLVVTVDCGTSDHLGVAQAGELGMEVVVTDHHQLPPGPLVPARAFINPQQDGCALPKDLAGAGVAFYLALGLRAALREEGYFQDRPQPNLRQALDLVAIGTLADVVPLGGLNRLLVKEGLKELNRLQRPGLAALSRVAGLKQPIGARDVGFMLAPRINAAGRLDSAATATELLLSSNSDQAMNLARKLDRLNQKRKDIERKVFEQAKKQVGSRPGLDSAPCLVLAEEGWHPGVLGIVASRMVEAFKRPVMLFGINNGQATGSGRSVEGFHLQKALAGQKHLMTAYGGHAMAAAAKLPTASLEELSQALVQAAEASAQANDAPQEMVFEAKASLAELGPGAMAGLEGLAPFGPGNPEPLLAVPCARVMESRVVGEGHLKLALGQGGHRVEAIGFNLAHLKPSPGALLDIAAAPRVSSFRGRRVELEIKDLRPSG